VAIGVILLRYAMDGVRRSGKLPLEVRREFASSSRLEAHVLKQTYELIVPVIHRRVTKAKTLWDLIEAQPDDSPPTRTAQGA